MLPHLIRAHEQAAHVTRCDTCAHSEHGAPCRTYGCYCRGMWADVPEAWLPVKVTDDDELEEQSA